MSSILEEQPLAQVTPTASKLKTWLPIALFAILWVDLIRQLSYTWNTNEQYAYGWFVPILALALFIKKWPTRPVISGPSASTPPFQLSTFNFQLFGRSRPFPLSAFNFQLFKSPQFLLSAFCFLLLSALLPLRLIHEINQDWSFCSYLLALVVVVLSLYAVFLMGGWPWVWHFAFPICFILVAVNWPSRIENSLKYRMMNAVAAMTVEIAGWLNIPALRHGNVIELATGSVGVEDACSGIRSLQSTIMAGFFLGELYLLNVPRRFFLLAVGVPLAFCLNIVRTLFLTWQASSAGAAAVGKWHDSAGMTISLVCFGGLWLIALLVRKGEIGNPESRKQKTENQGVPSQLSAFNFQLSEPSPAVSSPVVSSPPFPLSAFNFQLSEPSPVLSSPPFQPLLPRRYLVAVGLWSLLCIGATEAWYRAHETDPAQTVRWSAQFPTDSPTARKIFIKNTKSLLKYDQGDALSWEEPHDCKWSGYFFRWRAGEATSRMAARDHRPEICLPSTGFKVKADSGIHFLPAHGLELPFRSYVFEDAGRVLYVFFCLWEDGADKQHGLGRSKYLDRLDSVLAGRRRLGQQTLEIIVSGYTGMPEAEEAVRQRLPTLVQLGRATDKVASLDQPNDPMKAHASGAFP